MRAAVLRRPGSAERIDVRGVPTPVLEPGGLLVRVAAATVTAGDVVMRKMPGLVARLVGEVPRAILGYEYAGDVVAIDSAVERFRVGDRVFGTTTGLRQGAHARYVAVPGTGTATHLPDTVGFEQAAPIPVGAMTALHALRSAAVVPGSKLLVNGASGRVGTLAVQIGKHLGAEVTGVSGRRNLALVASLGADLVLDYGADDIAAAAAGQDVVFDVAGTMSSAGIRRELRDHVTLVTTRTRRQERREDLEAVAEMLGTGSIRAVVGRRHTLEDIREAHRSAEADGRYGSVLVTVAPNETRRAS